ncbi:alpha/beta fold hydrolase [Thalassococcus sp. S3]|uniref:alpha/beta fold hydrolase n=1 Tax=Thalassococcus sp. S3 TaxID=2017482 RepID=UPI0010248919|nr:alpha/beta hydrolase [Thalassococcus sp. S3]QBF29809.1 hypothetical protein CFI11_01070 [Thalassococcus sp. S3]
MLAPLRRLTDYVGPGALYHVEGPVGPPPVLLTHGTFSSARTCLPVAVALARHRSVYIIEWRGRSHGVRAKMAFGLHDLADGEMSQAIAHVADAASAPVHIMAHSGGGLAMILAIAHAAQIRDQVRSLTTLGTQATHLHLAPLPFRLALRVLSAQGRLTGRWPNRLLRLGDSDEAAQVLRDWLDMNAARDLVDRSGRSVLPRLAELSLPALVLAGAADRHIAPAEGCRALARAFGQNGRFHLCCRDNGDAEDFSHARLWRSRAAERTVWPRIVSFMNEIDADALAS